VAIAHFVASPGNESVPTQETAEGNLGAAEDREAARTAVGVAVVEAVVVEAMAEAVAVHRRIRLLVAAVTEAAVEAAHRLLFGWRKAALRSGSGYRAPDDVRSAGYWPESRAAFTKHAGN